MGDVWIRVVTPELTMLAATLVPGIGRMVNGSRRWLRLGMLSFQPSELAKLAVVPFLAYERGKKDGQVNSRVLLVPWGVLAAIFGAILLVPAIVTYTTWMGKPTASQAAMVAIAAPAAR